MSLFGYSKYNGGKAQDTVIEDDIFCLGVEISKIPLS